MNRVVVAIGSNIEREKNITTALNSLEENFGELLISQVYESKNQAKNKTNNELDKKNYQESSYYYNLVVEFYSNNSAAEIKEILLKVESDQGRKRQSGQVSIDLDLLLFGDQIIELERGSIPHSDIVECDYVLRPLAELLPENIHPILSISFADLWLEFEGKSELCPVDFVWQSRVISTAVTLPLL
jgi:2-amino-4-hydroxy-6-hydroxymethyldihydropteridine diphosphokinase